MPVKVDVIPLHSPHARARQTFFFGTLRFLFVPSPDGEGADPGAVREWLLRSGLLVAPPVTPSRPPLPPPSSSLSALNEVFNEAFGDESGELPLSADSGCLSPAPRALLLLLSILLQLHAACAAAAVVRVRDLVTATQVQAGELRELGNVLRIL